MQIDLIEQLPGYIAWKDRHFHYLGCNARFAKSLKLKDPKSIIGLTDRDMNTESEEAILFYEESDKLAIDCNSVKLIHQVGTPNIKKAFFLEKKPLFNVNNQLVGIILHCNELSQNTTLQQLQTLDKKYCPKNLLPAYYHIEEKNSFNLSPRELECLFCLLRGLPAKKIAMIINLSTRTIEFYIENIKNKFGCHNKTELCVKAISAGYMGVIPNRFLHTHLDFFN